VQQSGARLTCSAPTPTQIVVLLAAVFALARQINESEAEEDGVSGARCADDDEHQSDSSGETANRDQDDAPRSITAPKIDSAAAACVRSWSVKARLRVRARTGLWAQQ
jgi:hypothetical protein